MARTTRRQRIGTLPTRRGQASAGGTSGRRLLLAALLGAALCVGAADARAAPEPSRSQIPFQAGVLELAGTTALSVQYQNEGGGVREFTQLRVTPSVGYFVYEGLEVLLGASYIHNILPFG